GKLEAAPAFDEQGGVGEIGEGANEIDPGFDGGRVLERLEGVVQARFDFLAGRAQYAEGPVCLTCVVGWRRAGSDERDPICIHHPAADLAKQRVLLPGTDVCILVEE